MPDPKIQLQPPAAAPVVSRPLRTAASFVLVLPKRRVIYRHWDKEVYLPGEEAELVLEGEGIGDQKYEFVVEKAGSEDGPWEPVASLQAKVEGERASAKYKFPKAEPKGRLSKAEWARARASPGDRLGLHVEAQGYEGGFLSIHVERQQENGSWDVYTRWQGTIEQGKYDGVFPVPPREGASAGQAITAGRASGALEVDGKIVELSFEQDPVEGGTAWMAARTENLDGSQIRFVLERADEGGTWVEVGSAVSTVTQGRARNSVAMPPGASRSATPESATESRDAVRFAVARLHTHDQVVVSVDPGWLKGESYEVILERRPLDSEGNWESGGAVEQPAASGERVAQPGAREPDAASRQESAGDRPDEHGEVVRAEERHPPAPPEAVQVAPGPRGGESPAPQPGAPHPAAQAQPASAPSATQPERPPATAASQGQSAPVPRGSPAQPERPPEIAQAKRPVAPPTPQAQPEPTSRPLQERPAPARPAPQVQVAPAPAAPLPQAQHPPAMPDARPSGTPAAASPASAAPQPPAAVSNAPPSRTAAQPNFRPAISVQGPPDPSLASLPGSGAPAVPASPSATLPVAPQASETLAAAGASGAFSSGATVPAVAAVEAAPSVGGRFSGAERVPQGLDKPGGDSFSDALSKVRDAKDKAKGAKSKLEKAQELVSDAAPPDEGNVKE